MEYALDSLFSPDGDAQAHLAACGIPFSTNEIAIHHALATRTLPPDEKHLRPAAAWLAKLFVQLGAFPQSARMQVALALDDKSALLHRLAYQHVPTLAAELEVASSPLFPIDAAARFLPEVQSASAGSLTKFRHTMSNIQLPSPDSPGADAAWHENRRRLQQLSQRDNPERFLTWPVIANSMFMSDARVAAVELAALKMRPDYATRWLPALQEDALGAPARTPLHPTTSNNLIHHAYNVLQFENHAGRPISELRTILEFGGGYGSTARLVRRLGFRGRYTILDLPEFSALQQFYLGNLGFAKEMDFVASIDSIAPAARAPDLFLATWSLSETPIAFRPQIIPVLLNAKCWLIAYQACFGEADNLRFFSDIAQMAPHKRVADYAIPQLPGNRYLVASSD